MGTHWENQPAEPSRPVWQALRRGLRLRCPSCGTGKLFARFTSVNDQCASCGEELHHHRADDAPPYFIIVILGHVLVAAIIPVEVYFKPPIWVHMALWFPLAIGLSLALLPPIKGAVIAYQWALRMHGFGGAETEEEFGHG